MNHTRYSIIREPRGAHYRQMLTSLARLRTSALLVLHDGIVVALGSPGQGIVAALRDHRASEHRASKWPGTELFYGGEATVISMPLDAEALAILLAATSRLYGWRQPDLPEDPCLFRADGSVVLATIAHEADAYVDLTADEWAQVQLDWPGAGAHLEAET